MDAAGPGLRVRLTLSCTNLRNKDWVGKSDPLIALYMNPEENPVTGTPVPSTEIFEHKRGWVEVNRTECVNNNLNPNFSVTMELDYFFEIKQSLRFVIYDIDSKRPTQDLSKEDFIGLVDCCVGDLVSARQGLAFFNVRDKHGVIDKNGGRMKVQVEEIKGETKSMLHLQLCCVSLKKMDWFGSSDPFLVFSRVKRDGSRTEVHTTEVIKDNLNPQFKPIVISYSELCNGNDSQPFRLEVWDWDRTSSPDLIGYMMVCVRDLHGCISTNGGIIRFCHPKGKRQDVGALSVRGVQVESPVSFLDYLSGGCEINLMVAIDFTASNGNPKKPDSLHFMNPDAMNEYQKAIIAVGEILQVYDHDKHFPCWGFGAKIAGTVSNCFPLNGDASKPAVEGVQGVLNAYAQTLMNCSLWGPTNFADILGIASDIANQGVASGAQRYSVLLILTDGVITDMEQSVAKIVEASSGPLSIIIVGVGSADFTQMQKLDGDEEVLTSTLSGTPIRAVRDIVQFVPFRRFSSEPASLAKEVLEEIPQQLVQFFASRSIAPLK